MTPAHLIIGLALFSPLTPRSPVKPASVKGQEMLSTGEGALFVLGAIFLLTQYASKRVPR